MLDFYLNWQLYFPQMGSEVAGFSFSGDTVKRLFLAAPFTQLLQKSGQTATVGNYRGVLEGLIDLFDANSIEVFNAHKREEWGAKQEHRQGVER